MFAGCLQIMWAHSHLIRAEGIGYLQLIRAENADVCRPLQLSFTTRLIYGLGLIPNRRNRAIFQLVQFLFY